MALVVKTGPASAGDIRDLGSIPVSGRTPGGEMVTLSIFLPGEAPWTEETGVLQSMGLQRLRQDNSNLARSTCFDGRLTGQMQKH